MENKTTKSHFDSTGDDSHSTETSKSYTTVTGIDPYDLGYATATEDIRQYLKTLGEALCRLLGILPGNQVSVIWDVSEKCKLKLTISKEV